MTGKRPKGIWETMSQRNSWRGSPSGSKGMAGDPPSGGVDSSAPRLCDIRPPGSPSSRGCCQPSAVEAPPRLMVARTRVPRPESELEHVDNDSALESPTSSRMFGRGRKESPELGQRSTPGAACRRGVCKQRSELFGEQQVAQYRKSDLLHQVLPPQVADALRQGTRFSPETFDEVTIFFSDIVGFTQLASELPAKKVLDLLDRLYEQFDRLADQHSLYKVETIGDAYICVAGLPKAQDDHAVRVASFAMEAVAAAERTLVDLDDDRRFISIRAGLHSGSILACVTSDLNPRYSLIGETLHLANCMEAASQPNMINMSHATKAHLHEQCCKLQVAPRGPIVIPSRPAMECFFMECSGHNKHQAAVHMRRQQLTTFCSQKRLLVRPMSDHAASTSMEPATPMRSCSSASDMSTSVSSGLSPSKFRPTRRLSELRPVGISDHLTGLGLNSVDTCWLEHEHLPSASVEVSIEHALSSPPHSPYGYEVPSPRPCDEEEEGAACHASVAMGRGRSLQATLPGIGLASMGLLSSTMPSIPVSVLNEMSSPPQEPPRALRPTRRNGVQRRASWVGSAPSGNSEVDTDKLLHQMLPPRVAASLVRGEKVMPEEYDQVTLVFISISNFQKITQTMAAPKVLDLLQRLFSKLDRLVRKYLLYKVETIGDEFVVAGNLTLTQKDHAVKAAAFANDAIAAARIVQIDLDDPSSGTIDIRAGIHTGTVVASVVGVLTPRYCLFGDTVNVAARMKGRAAPGEVNVSAAAASHMEEQSCGRLSLESQGLQDMKGKGKVEVFTLGKTLDISPYLEKTSRSMMHCISFRRRKSSLTSDDEAPHSVLPGDKDVLLSPEDTPGKSV